MSNSAKFGFAPVDRKVGRHHIAFFRGVILGMSIGDMADRYLESGMDIRVAKSTLTWIRDTLRQAALRRGKRRDAHLLRMRFTTTANSAVNSSLPSLEDFRAEIDPDGFFMEKEIIQSYLDAYPQAADVKGRKRQLLIDKQIAALKWIEPLIAVDPVRADWITAWFDKTIASRLALAKITTLDELMSHISARGFRWWVDVPRLGIKGAARIVSWLQGYESSLGVLPPHSLAPVRDLSPVLLNQSRPQCTEVVPLESFDVPSSLDGRNGSNRYPGLPRIDASNDYRAIFAWLDTKSGNPNTRRAYQKEAERILLWSVLERAKALSDLSVEDCGAYRDWLALLGRVDDSEWAYRIKQSTWIGERKVERYKSNWKPFDGALSSGSVKHALTIVGNLFEWLVRVQYCAFNPWGAVSRVSVAKIEEDAPDTEMMRAFSKGQWNYLMQYLTRLPETPSAMRLAFVLPFAQATGLRISEMVDATIGRMYAMPLSDDVGLRWMLKVYGKGGKWRAVPLTNTVCALLETYLVSRGLQGVFTENPKDTPLIAAESMNVPISASALSKSICALFKEVAASLVSAGKVTESKVFERATVHWLRHTCGSHLALTGVPVNIIQRLLGHASLQTTSIYTDTSDENLWRAVEMVNKETDYAHGV